MIRYLLLILTTFLFPVVLVLGAVYLILMLAATVAGLLVTVSGKGLLRLEIWRITR